MKNRAEELAAALAANVAEDEAAEAAVQAGESAFAFANATVSQLEKDLKEAQDQNAALSAEALKVQQLESVVTSAKASQEHAEHSERGAQELIVGLRAQLAAVTQEADAEKLVAGALEGQLAKEAAEVAQKDEEIAELQHAGEEVEADLAVLNKEVEAHLAAEVSPIHRQCCRCACWQGATELFSLPLVLYRAVSE